jgi:hypothetical protein
MKRFTVIFSLAVLVLTAACAGAVSSAAAFDISVFSLKDGRVYKGDKEIELPREVEEAPAEAGGPIRFLAALGSDIDDAVAEEETGVYFFTADGVCLTFVPLESAYEYQGIFFSPDGAGEKFVLQTGSGMRPDMFFAVYGEGTEKIAELAGMRGGCAWIDPVRFVFTRIDDTRETEDGVYIPFALRLSVVMFDTAMKEEFVLKEATATQNFWLGEVIEDGSAVTVLEDSVKSEKDWGDEDKIERREIRVEIPAAG